MLTPADYKLADLLGIAGATIGIIIAGAILLGGFDGKYGSLLERYRSLTGEYRGNSVSDPRRRGLRSQIANYRRRLRLMNIAAGGMMLALLLFVATVALASLSVIYPHAPALRLAGTVSLFAGLLLIGAAVCLGFVEVVLSREVIAPEVEDFSDLDGPGAGGTGNAAHAGCSRQVR